MAVAAETGLVVVAACLLLFAACCVLALRLRALAKQRDEAEDRAGRCSRVLWASNQRYWEYHLPSERLQYLVSTRGFDPHETDLASLVHPDDLANVTGAMQRYVDGGSEAYMSEHRIRRAEGGDGSGWTWVRARGRAVEHHADGRILRVAGTSLDIDRERAMERENRIAGEVLRGMNAAAAVLDRNFRVVSINPAFTRITGHAADDIVGHSACVLDSVQHGPPRTQEMRDALERGGRWSGEAWQQRSSGEEFLCAIEAATVADGYAEGGRLHVLMFTDITMHKRAEEELRWLANYDALTNLPNRALFTERLSRAILRARREDTRVAVLLLDVDRFRDINDSFGHTVGDRLLRTVACHLQEVAGRERMVARVTGDEFAIILEDLASPEDAERATREIIMAFERPLLVGDGLEIPVGVSVGISLYPDHAQVPSDLLKRADAAMYHAKTAGRRTWLSYDHRMEEGVRRRATLAGALHKALDRGELHVAYQPRQQLASSRITGVEALLRWTSAEHGEVPPADFIPLAEGNGMILEIGEWILREACLALRRWHDAGLSDLRVSVNMSVLQLLRGDFAEVVRRVLDDAGVPPQALELEVTESMLMANAEQAARKLQDFRELGVSIAIDDFGTGYSSLAYLKRLPINTIKIDQTFIADLGHDPDDASITATVIAMAHGLGLDVVAEGVETAGQARFLAEHRCDEIQGFWVSPPLDGDACLALLRSHAEASAGPHGASMP